MFAEFRFEVVATIVDAMPDVPVWDVIPDDVNELPCIVVGRPGGRPTAQAVVFDLDLSVFVIGRRQQAGGQEAEVTQLADRLFDALGGTRGCKSPAGIVLAITRLDPRMISIAGSEYPAFTVDVETSATTC